MEKINLKDILNGKLTKLPCELNTCERLEFAIALADALAALQQTDFPDVIVNPEIQHNKELRIRYNEFAEITDNFILFLLNEDNEFSVEHSVAAFLRAIRVHQLHFDSDTDAFCKLYKDISPWIVSSRYETVGVYVGDGQYDKDWKPSEDKKLVAGSGGHFTLRDHHKSK